jgi:hypothetical protein
VYFIFRLVGLSVTVILAFKSRLLVFMKFGMNVWRQFQTWRLWEKLRKCREQEMHAGSLLGEMGFGEKVTRV